MRGRMSGARKCFLAQHGTKSATAAQLGYRSRLGDFVVRMSERELAGRPLAKGGRRFLSFVCRSHAKTVLLGKAMIQVASIALRSKCSKDAAMPSV